MEVTEDTGVIDDHLFELLVLCGVPESVFYGECVLIRVCVCVGQKSRWDPHISVLPHSAFSMSTGGSELRVSYACTASGLPTKQPLSQTPPPHTGPAVCPSSLVDSRTWATTDQQ